VSNFHEIIRYPSITEKNTALRTAENKYVFEVAPKATKPQIKEAVEKLFNVKVIGVNTSITKGKKKRMGKFSGYQPDWKKAFVRLAQGQTIDKFGEV
jgi:large subunit ribosomal protein L23